MKAGDIIPEKIDHITESGFSVQGRVVEEVEDVTGAKRLILGARRHRQGIAKNQFRMDPADEDSELDEAAYTAALEAEIEKIAPAAKMLAKVQALRYTLDEAKALIIKRTGQRDSAIARIAELESVIEGLRNG